MTRAALLFFLLAAPLLPQAQKAAVPSHTAPRACRAVRFRGQVEAGKSFMQPLGHDLLFQLRAIPSGWRVEVLPQHPTLKPAPPHDLAEIATPPYASPSPLLLSTDYSFRAQDAAGWNPRTFRFLASAAQWQPLSADLDQLLAHPKDATAAAALLTATSHAPSGNFRLTRVTFLAGSADLAGTAAGISSHLRFTPHEVLSGPVTPLGKLVSVAFEVVLQLDPSRYQSAAVEPATLPCAP